VSGGAAWRAEYWTFGGRDRQAFPTVGLTVASVQRRAIFAQPLEKLLAQRSGDPVSLAPTPIPGRIVQWPSFSLIAARPP